MLRLGVITSLNVILKTGIITDSNDQEIDFVIDPLTQSLRISDGVQFLIYLSELGLRATNIVVIDQNN